MTLPEITVHHLHKVKLKPDFYQRAREHTIHSKSNNF